MVHASCERLYSRACSRSRRTNMSSIGLWKGDHGGGLHNPRMSESQVSDKWTYIAHLTKTVSNAPPPAIGSNGNRNICNHSTCRHEQKWFFSSFSSMEFLPPPPEILAPKPVTQATLMALKLRTARSDCVSLLNSGQHSALRFSAVHHGCIADRPTQQLSCVSTEPWPGAGRALTVCMQLDLVVNAARASSRENRCCTTSPSQTCLQNILPAYNFLHVPLHLIVKNFLNLFLTLDDLNHNPKQTASVFLYLNNGDRGKCRPNPRGNASKGSV